MQPVAPSLPAWSGSAGVLTAPRLAAGARFAVYCAAVLMLAIGWNGDFPLDDAYITLHNARALLHGWDTTYMVSPLVGATSLVHLGLLAGLGLAMPLPLASLVLCLVAAAAYAVGLDVLVRRAGARSWRVPVLTLTGMLVGSMPTLMVNGLETGLACATVTWLLVLHRRLPLLAGIAPFVRPELAILAGLAMLKKLQGEDHRERAMSIALALAVALPFVIWSYLETGNIVPSTMAAKIAFFREQPGLMVERGWMLAKSLAFTGFMIVVPGLMALRHWRAWTFLVIFLGALMLLLPASVAWNSGRYLAPLVPIAVLGWAQASRGQKVPALVAFLAIYLVLQLPQRLADLDRDRRWNAMQAEALRSSLGDLPSGSRILIHDAGLPAWVAPRLHLIDVVGLKTPSSIASHKATTRQVCHWGQALDRIARSQNAHYALVLQKPLWNCVGSNLSDQGWRLSLRPSHGGAYSLYAVTKPPRPGGTPVTVPD